MTQLSSTFPNNFPNWITKTAAYSAANGDFIAVNTTAGPITITLPASPSVNSVINFMDPQGTWGTNNLIVVGNGNNISGSTSTLVCDVSNGFYLIYVGGTVGWKFINGNSSVAGIQGPGGNTTITGAPTTGNFPAFSGVSGVINDSGYTYSSFHQITNPIYSTVKNNHGQVNAQFGNYVIGLRNDGTNGFLVQSANSVNPQNAALSSISPLSWNLSSGAVTIDATGAGTTFGGLVSATTPTAGDNSTKLATTAFVTNLTSGFSSFPINSIVAKTATFTATTAQKGTMFDLTGSFNIVLPAASGGTISAPLYYHVRKRDRSGTCTLSLTGSDAWEDAATGTSKYIYQESFTVFAIGTGKWYFAPGTRKRGWIETGNISLAGGVTYITLSSTFFADVEIRDLEFNFYGCSFGGAGTQLTLVATHSISGPATFYSNVIYNSSTTAVAALSQDSQAASGNLTYTNTTNSYFNGKLNLFNVQSTVANSFTYISNLSEAYLQWIATGVSAGSGALTNLQLTVNFNNGSYSLKIYRP